MRKLSLMFNSSGTQLFRNPSDGLDAGATGLRGIAGYCCRNTKMASNEFFFRPASIENVMERRS
jgi:PII-like signaling protein